MTIIVDGEARGTAVLLTFLPSSSHCADYSGHCANYSGLRTVLTTVARGEVTIIVDGEARGMAVLAFLPSSSS